MRWVVMLAIPFGTGAIAQDTSNWSKLHLELLEMEVARDISARLCPAGDEMCRYQTTRLSILLACLELYEMATVERLACFDRRSAQFMPAK